MAKYYVGDKVLMADKRTAGMNSDGKMDKFLGTVMTISIVSELDCYYMVEDDFNWLWSDHMVKSLAEEKPKKVTVHPDFEKWYAEIEERWTSSYKEYAIICINQIGFSHGLENSYKKDVSDKFNVLRADIQANKEKYTRAVLDGYTVEREQRYYVKFPEFPEGYDTLNKDTEDGEISIDDTDDSPSYYKTQFTETEINAIDPRYMAFAVPVEETEAV